MWAVCKPNGDNFLFYTGSNGNWSNVHTCAAQWPDRRDAWRAIVSNRYVGRAHTTWISHTQSNMNQIVPEEDNQP